MLEVLADFWRNLKTPPMDKEVDPSYANGFFNVYKIYYAMMGFSLLVMIYLLLVM